MNLSSTLRLFAAFAGSLLFSSCGNDPVILTDGNLELRELLIETAPNRTLDDYKLPASNDYTNIPQDKNNPLTRMKVELGKHLFHETAISLDAQDHRNEKTFSCASCHHVDAGFQSGMRQGIGEGGLGFGFGGEGRFPNPECDKANIDVQPLKSPSALNIAYQNSILWNGQFGNTPMNRAFQYKWTSGTPLEKNHLGFLGVETQAIAGMGVHRLTINEDLVATLGYKSMFDQAFADIPETERYTAINAGLAIAAYERTLLANQAPFQRWLNGEYQAMSEAETRGAILFFGKGRCLECHAGPALNSMAFYALGMADLLGSEIIRENPDDPAHLGRGSFTGVKEDMYKFKVPQLYNLKEARFYGHGASFQSVRAVIEYKNQAIPENGHVTQAQLADGFTPLQLTDKEITDLTLFVENGLSDPNLRRYVPTSLPSGNCFPNADYLSKLDLGCD